jgi:hypothetical protein
MAVIGAPGAAQAATMSPVRALIVVPIVLALVGAFIALSAALGSVEYYAGFFFLLYWVGLQRADFASLPSSAIGAAFGLGLAFALHYLTATFGPTNGVLAFLLVIVPVIFCQVAGLFPLLVNNAAMLLLTAGTISHVQAHASFRGMFISLALGIGFFGGLVWIAGKLGPRPAAGAPTGSV